MQQFILEMYKQSNVTLTRIGREIYKSIDLDYMKYM
jgi:hypothetical protein